MTIALLQHWWIKSASVIQFKSSMLPTVAQWQICNGEGRRETVFSHEEVSGRKHGKRVPQATHEHWSEQQSILTALNELNVVWSQFNSLVVTTCLLWCCTQHKRLNRMMTCFNTAKIINILPGQDIRYRNPLKRPFCITKPHFKIDANDLDNKYTKTQQWGQA